MKKMNYELQVLVNGRPIREYYQNGRTFVEARKTVEYELKFRNNTWQRVLAVFSVDGINVVDGKQEWQSGYVVEPWQSVTVKGYRINDDSVANFKFGEAGASYASLMENGNDVYDAMDNPSQNNGVIGVRVWSEKEWPVIKPIKYRSSLNDDLPRWDGTVPATDYIQYDYTTSVSPTEFLCSGQSGGVQNTTVSAQACTRGLLDSSADFTVGTEWGDEQRDHVRQTSFEKGALQDTLLIYYMDRVNMEKAGIDLKKKPSVALPSAFGEFCKRPSNWRG